MWDPAPLVVGRYPRPNANRQKLSSLFVLDLTEVLALALARVINPPRMAGLLVAAVDALVGSAVLLAGYLFVLLGGGWTEPTTRVPDPDAEGGERLVDEDAWVRKEHVGFGLLLAVMVIHSIFALAGAIRRCIEADREEKARKQRRLARRIAARGFDADDMAHLSPRAQAELELQMHVARTAGLLPPLPGPLPPPPPPAPPKPPVAAVAPLPLAGTSRGGDGSSAGPSQSPTAAANPLTSSRTGVARVDATAQRTDGRDGANEERALGNVTVVSSGGSRDQEQRRSAPRHSGFPSQAPVRAARYA